MKIVNVTGQDTGNQSYLLSRAINEYTSHHSVSLVRSAPLGWPADVLYRDEWGNKIPEWIQTYWENADVIHTHWWMAKNYWCPSKKGAGWVIHQHNTRGGKKRFRAVDDRRKAIRVVSTLNLMPFVNWDFSRWFPRPVTVYAKQEIRRRQGPLLVTHSPTSEVRKQTDVFVRVMERLQQKYDVRYEILTGMSHDEVMVRKARADILYDQLVRCYGTSALEAWALGIPVVTGMSDELNDFILDEIGYAPYVWTRDEEALYTALENLILDEKYRQRMSEVGWEYVNKYHRPSYCAELAITTYREAIAKNG
jgi:glycosyltransferase involved in cell wall biosynthesis